jgi:hypothetical protein
VPACGGLSLGGDAMMQRMQDMMGPMMLGMGLVWLLVLLVLLLAVAALIKYLFVK